jgi:DNA-binding transcriptional regulator YdaS (Cro superfamily)
VKNSEFQKFDATVRKVLSVSREELKRREVEWKTQHGTRKAGRKSTKISASDHASTAKD